MSCHDIGHGLNNVVEHILEKYDNGDIPFHIAKELIGICRDSVNYCDGNMYEAIECFREQGRCTCCLEVKETVYCYDLPNDLSHLESWVDKMTYESELLGAYVCKECLLNLYKKSVEG